MKRNNKLFLIIITFLLFFYTFNDNFKVLVNTSYNKYSNILEVNINRLYNKLLNKSSIILNTSKNQINNNVNSKSNLVLLLTIFTGILFTFINFYNKSSINSISITLYLILIIITFYLIK